MKILEKIKKIINIFIYIIFVGIFYVCISKYISFSKPFKINQTIIEGNSFISSKEILELIQSEINNKDITKLNLDKIKNIILKNNFIVNSKVHIEFPSKLFISIEEINPIALMEIENLIYFLDENKNIIEADYKSINFFTGTPVVSSTNYSNNIDQINDIIVRLINQTNNLYKKINEIHFFEDEIVFLLNNNTNIILSNKDYDMSLKKLIGFNKQFIEFNNLDINNYKYINVSIQNQIITKLNNNKI